MSPTPNPQMNQPNRRPPQPMGQVANQPGQLNQNGQAPAAPTSAFSTGEWRDQQAAQQPQPQPTEAPPQMRYGQRPRGHYGQHPQTTAAPSHAINAGVTAGASTSFTGTDSAPGNSPANQGAIGLPQRSSDRPSSTGDAYTGAPATPLPQSAMQAPMSVQPLQQAQPEDAPMPAPMPPAPGPNPMPQAARENTSGPMKPPMPYQRQQLPAQQQMQRRIQPQGN